MNDPGAEWKSAIDRLVEAEADAKRLSRRRSLLPLGCLIALLAPFLLVGGCLFVSSLNDGGIADEATLRPLPPNIEVVRESEGCPGNGDGWHSCERRIRFRRQGASAEALRRDVLAHYQSAAVLMRAVGTFDDCPGAISLDHSSDRELNDYLCVYVESATSYGELGRAKPSGDEVDVVAQTFSNEW